MKTPLATLAAALLALPAAAQDLSADAAAMAAAIEKAGCVVDTRTSVEVQQSLDFTEDQINAAVLELFQLGLLKLETSGSSGRLYTPACQ